MNEHLDPLGLDAVRAGEATDAESRHVAACETCSQAVNDLTVLAQRLASPRIDVPAEIDRAILAKKRSTGRRGLWISSLSAAAAILFVFLLVKPASKPLDIVDAYQLAKRLKSGSVSDRNLDVTGDGLVDQRDVDEIARRSVMIK